MKYLNKTPSGILALVYENVEANTDKEKVDLLNNFFSSCFNTYASPVRLKMSVIKGAILHASCIFSI